MQKACPSRPLKACTPPTCPPPLGGNVDCGFIGSPQLLGPPSPQRRSALAKPAPLPPPAYPLVEDARPPGKSAEAESRIGGPTSRVAGSRPKAPPAAASPLWRRPCSPPRRGRPPGSPAAATSAACAIASAFPPAPGRTPPPRCCPLRCGHVGNHKSCD